MALAAPNPVGGRDYPRTLREFNDWFRDEAACATYLARLRWPSAFACPACGGTKAWWLSEGRFRCAGCRRKTSVTAGTIFADTHLPLKTWFAACWYATSQKPGVSALGLQRVLGLGSYESAWSLLHKLRRAMVRPDRDRLAGELEVDESYVGGSIPGKRGRGELVRFGAPTPVDEVDLEPGCYVLSPMLAASLVGEAEEPADDDEALDAGEETDGGARRYSVRFEATVSQLFRVLPALQNLADTSADFRARLEVKAEGREPFDPNWLRNAVEEHFDEAGIEGD